MASLCPRVSWELVANRRCECFEGSGSLEFSTVDEERWSGLDAETPGVRGVGLDRRSACSGGDAAVVGGEIHVRVACGYLQGVAGFRLTGEQQVAERPESALRLRAARGFV